MPALSSAMVVVIDASWRIWSFPERFHRRPGLAAASNAISWRRESEEPN
jgi:hypothetical protein